MTLCFTLKAPYLLVSLFLGCSFFFFLVLLFLLLVMVCFTFFNVHMKLGIGSVAVVQTFKPTPIRLSLREENAISDIGAGDEHSCT